MLRRARQKSRLGWVAASFLIGCDPDPTSPPEGAPGALVWEYATPDGIPLAAERDTRGQPYLYVALKQGGVAVLRLNGSGAPVEVARVSRSSLGGLDAMTLVQSGARLVVGLGDFFAAQGAKAGLAVIDVQTPGQASVSARWTSSTTLSGSAAVLVDGTTAFLGAMREGVFIFDLSQPDTARLVTTFLPDPDYPTPDPTAVQHPNARGFALAGNLLYVADDAGGLRIVDVTNRAAPAQIGRYVNAAMAGKQQAYNSVAVTGGRAYVATDYCGLEILDVSNPADIRQLGWWNPWACQTAANTWFNSPGHTNQLLLDASRRLVSMSAGASQLQVVDVSDPASPVKAGEFRAAAANQGAWGIAAAADETYVLYISAIIPFLGTWNGIRAVTSFR